MAFESEHNMPIDGSLTPQLWNALFAAQQRGERNTNGYTCAIANQGSPERLTIWHNGQVVSRRRAARPPVPVSYARYGPEPVSDSLPFSRRDVRVGV